MGWLPAGCRDRPKDFQKIAQGNEQYHRGNGIDSGGNDGQHDFSSPSVGFLLLYRVYMGLYSTYCRCAAALWRYNRKLRRLSSSPNTES